MKRVAERTAEREEAAHPMRTANHRRVERPTFALIEEQRLVNRARTCAGRERCSGVARVRAPQFVEMYAYRRGMPAGQQRRTVLELREFFPDRARPEKLFVLAPDQRGESETANARHYQDAAVGMEFRSENIGMACGPIDVDDKEGVVILRAREFDPHGGAHRGRRPVGANDQAGAHFLLEATVGRQRRAAYAPAIFKQPHNAGAITNLDPPRRLRGFDDYALDFRMWQHKIRIGHTGQRERNVEQKAGAIMEELHPADFAGASGAA